MFKNAMKKKDEGKQGSITPNQVNVLKYLEKLEDVFDVFNLSGSSVNKKVKILTKQEMLSRLPILLAQIQAGNNSLSLKNEIRQLIYSLYRSKMLTKTVYNNLIKVI